MADFPTALTAAEDNVTDVLAKHLNDLEAKIGIDGSAVTSSLDYKISQTSTKTYIDSGDEVLASEVRCSAYLSTDQLNLPDATGALVELDAVIYDSGSDFNTGTHRFVIPVTGYYHVCASIRFTNTLIGKYNMQVVKETGSLLKISVIDYTTTVGDELVLASSNILYLSEGNYLELRCRIDVGGATVDIDDHKYNTYLTVHLLSI